MKRLFLCNLSKWTFRLSLMVALLATLSLVGAAQTAGFDVFQTGAGTSVNLGALGEVKLQGVPIQGSTGNADTIIRRTQDVPPGGGTVTTEVYALFMKSTSPVSFGGTPADVYVTINNTGGNVSTSVLPQPDPLSPSTGTLTVRNDGTFDSILTVNADLIFVRAGTSVGNPGNYLGSQKADPITLTTKNSSWQSSPPAGYPGGLPSGGFFPFPKHTAPTHNHVVVPAVCQVQIIPIDPTPVDTASTDGTAAAATRQSGAVGSLIARPICVAAAQ